MDGHEIGPTGSVVRKVAGALRILNIRILCSFIGPPIHGQSVMDLWGHVTFIFTVYRQTVV